MACISLLKINILILARACFKKLIDLIIMLNPPKEIKKAVRLTESGSMHLESKMQPLVNSISPAQKPRAFFSSLNIISNM